MLRLSENRFPQQHESISSMRCLHLDECLVETQKDFTNGGSSTYKVMIENVIFYQAKSIMFHNVRASYRTFVRKIELPSKMLLDHVTPYSNTHKSGWSMYYSCYFFLPLCTMRSTIMVNKFIISVHIWHLALVCSIISPSCILTKWCSFTTHIVMFCFFFWLISFLDLDCCSKHVIYIKQLLPNIWTLQLHEM